MFFTTLTTLITFLINYNRETEQLLLLLFKNIFNIFIRICITLVQLLIVALIIYCILILLLFLFIYAFYIFVLIYNFINL
jgi:hypothetical protein